MGWQDDARRLIQGDKKELATFPGYWIRPKKYSVSQRDEIQAAMREIQKGIDKKALVEVMSKVRNFDDELDKEELMKSLSEENLAALLDSSNLPTAKLAEIRLRCGIAEHNFEGSTVEELARAMMEYPVVCDEMVKIVEDFNRPLASRTSKTSETSPNGSTTEPDSTTATSSPTGGSLQS